MPTPLYMQINDNAGRGRPLSGDTFDFVKPDEMGGDEPKGLDPLVIDGLRDLLFPAGTAATDDVIFDNMVGFYEISDTNGGTDANSEDDLIA